MKRMSVAFWWLVSALLLGSQLGASAQAHGNSKTENVWLPISAASNPEAVAEWLRTKKPTKIDAKDAQIYFRKGRKAQLGGNWSLASKAFGESLIRHPTPESLWQYAKVETRMLAEVRARAEGQADNADRDLQYVLGFYRSAVAANGVVGTLAPNALSQLQHSSKCLQEYVENKKSSDDCEPLRAYGLETTK